MAQSRNSDTITNLYLTLQRRRSGETGWTGITTRRDRQIGKNIALVDFSYPAEAGCSYRVYAVCVISDSNEDILETVTGYSGIVTY